MSNVKKIIISLLAIVAIVASDQFTKFLIIKNFTVEQEKQVFGNAFVLRYIRNTGAAWGSFAGYIPLLLVFTVIVLAALCYVYKNIIDEPVFLPVRICIVAIAGGAIGNMIDRVRLGFVVDFFYAKFINFPVFNVADIFVTVSVFVLIFLFIFKYNGEETDIIFSGRISSKTADKDKSDAGNITESDDSEEK